MDDAPGATRPNLYMYLKLLDSIQQQIRFADLKAGFIVALNALLFGFLATYFDAVRTLYASAQTRHVAFWCAVLLQVLYLAAMAAAVGIVIWTVMPRFGRRGPPSKVFFAEIATRYGTDCERFVRDTVRLSDDQWADEIGRQIVEVSHIALAKHRLVRQAAWYTLLAFALWRASLFAIVFLPPVPTP